MFEGLEMVKMFIEMSFYFALDTLNGFPTFFGSLNVFKTLTVEIWK